MFFKDELNREASHRVTRAVVVALRRIVRAIDVRSRYLVTRYGVTGPQLMVLKELSSLGPVSVGELTRAVHLSQPTVTGILDRLERRGLIERRRSEQDKRRVHVGLTPRGDELLADSPPVLQEEFTRQFQQLEDWEQTQILSSLQRVVAMMEARHIEATPILTSDPVDGTSEQAEAFLKHGSQDRLSGTAVEGVAESPEGSAAES